MRIQFLIILLCYLGRNSLVSADADEFYYDGDGEGADGISLTGSEFQELELAAVEMNHPYSEVERRPNYSFEFGIDGDDDEKERDIPKSRSHKRTNDGRKVQGQYRILQPDGMVKVVEYRTDPQTGNIKATIEYNHA